MTTSIRTLFLFASSFIFSVFTPVFADSYYKHTRYFLAPDITFSGISANSVNVASGKLNRSDIDLSFITLAFFREYSGPGTLAASLGGWNHNYSSQLVVNGLSHANWRGTKSNQYNGKSKACTSGWNDIKGSLFNGQLSSAKAKYRRGVCQISKSNKTVAEFIIHSSKSTSNSLVLSRPDGSTMSFVKSGRYWKTLSGAPFSLKRSGRNWKVKTPSDSIETYNRNGKLVRITNSSGQTTRLSYKSGKLDKVTGAFGKTLQLTYQNGKLDKVVGALGTVSYTYTGDLLTSVAKVDGSTMGYQYDGNKLTTVIDALGQTIASYTYDSAGRVATYAGQNNTRKTRYNYNSSGVQVTNIANNATDSYTFSVNRGVMKQSGSTNVDGSTATQSYDENGYPKESTAINGTKTRTEYNDRGLLVKRIESVGLASEKTTITHWHSSFRKPVLQVEDAIEVGSKATQSSYSRKGLVTRRIEGIIKSVQCKHKHRRGKGHDHHDHNHKLKIVLKDKRIARFSYNSKGQLTKTVASNGAVSLTSYDNNGNRTGSTNALGQENKILLLDVAGNVLKLQDASGIITNSTYDVAGRILTKTVNGRTTSNEYDAAGSQTKITNPDGSTTSNEYDASGNLVKTIDQDGNIRKSTFDSNGNQTGQQVLNDKGNVIQNSSSVYNNKNQLVKITDAQGNSTTYEYDSQGNRTKVTDANGNIIRNEYDENNRLVKTVNALGGETTYAYDTDGNRTRVTTPNGATTIFTYDSFNQLIKEVSTDRGTTTYKYDGNGNQIQITDSNGNQKNISYDILARKIGESWTDGPGLTIIYTYDNCGNGVGKLCGVTDKSGSTSFQYDTEGQIVQKTQNIDGVVLIKNYAYNNEGQLIGETYSSGAQISYGYNVDKIVSISINDNPYITDISYNAANQITGWTDTGSTETKSFSYDALNRLSEYAKADNVSTLQSQLFSYDANGNRTQLEDNGVQTVYSILANSNRVTQVGTTNYHYDTNGNIIDDGEHNYSYDGRNRLVGVDGISTYLFNANNMRVKKTTPAGTILYGWDNDRIFAEYDDKGDAIQETVYLGNTPVALLKDGNIFRIYADQIDTPRVITNNADTILWTWNSKPFGESLPDEDADQDGVGLVYNLRFPGQYYDYETGKHYNYHRDYNPITGRYIQSDPVGLEGGMNSFTYALGRPLNLTDPSGQWPTLSYGRWIDISLDFHNSPHSTQDTYSKLVSVLDTYKNIIFTVYVYPRDAAALIPYLKGRGVAVGVHVDDSTTEKQIDDFYTALGSRQPLNRTSASIHGGGSDRIKNADVMNKLNSYGVEFVRTASSNIVTGDGPKIKRVMNQEIPAIDIKGHSLVHYFTHAHQLLRLPDLNNN